MLPFLNQRWTVEKDLANIAINFVSVKSKNNVDDLEVETDIKETLHVPTEIYY